MKTVTMLVLYFLIAFCILLIFCGNIMSRRLLIKQFKCKNCGHLGELEKGKCTQCGKKVKIEYTFHSIFFKSKKCKDADGNIKLALIKKGLTIELIILVSILVIAISILIYLILN